MNDHTKEEYSWPLNNMDLMQVFLYMESDMEEPGTGRAKYNFNIQKTKIMASGPITSWQIDGETMETVRDFIFLDSKITADGEYSHEIRRHLLFGRKAMTNLDSIGPSSQSYAFSCSHIQMWELDHKEG